ncbi:unnamed protein product [Medioppia subpectinata]|uniref:Uncharacterized protein n=1 Tax=Medioppia subpectinata TaxID=1979941 RepID=A0A7R9Q4A0_9ACAR|nr:unnamed protein product [Medioppia subpectinata]CAG2111393.1 unnamed protein product [Medioppia subpectinata]
MFAKITIYLSAILIIAFVSQSVAKEEIKTEDLVQTCDKDDKLCQASAGDKAKESHKYSDDTSAKAGGSTDGGSTGKPTKGDKKIKKSTKVKSTGDDNVADCPLCSFTRPLVRKIMDWISELISDPMIQMVFEMVRHQIWEVGNMTKEKFGFRLF